MFVSNKEMFYKTWCYLYKNVAYYCSGEQSCVLDDKCDQSAVLSTVRNAVLDTPPATSSCNQLPLHCDNGLLIRSAGSFRFVLELILLLVQDMQATSIMHSVEGYGTEFPNDLSPNDCRDIDSRQLCIRLSYTVTRQQK